MDVGCGLHIKAQVLLFHVTSFCSGSHSSCKVIDVLYSTTRAREGTLLLQFPGVSISQFAILVILSHVMLHVWWLRYTHGMGHRGAL
jgi:hypothetical protein